MSVTFPWVLWGTLVAIAGVVAAHLLSVTQPRLLRLPTARFVPERAIRAVSRASTPRDVLLLLVRVALLLCIGGALAGLNRTATRVPVRTMIAVDGGALSLGDPAALADAMQRAARDAAPVSAILFGDTLVTVSDPSTASATMDSLLQSPRISAPSSLAATLLRARRAAPGIASETDSVRLVLVSLDRADATTASLDAVRATWPGGIVHRPIPLRSSAPDSTRAPAAVTVRAGTDDVVAAAFARWPGMATRNVLVVRDSVTRMDSAAANAGAAVVVWIPNFVPPRWTGVTDSVNGNGKGNGSALVAGGGALVAPVVRTASAPDDARTLVWWPDGSAAATEEPIGRGCVRWVGFTPPDGDALLSIDARPMLRTLAAECGSSFHGVSRPTLDSALLTRLTGGSALAARAGFGASPTASPSPFTRWMLVAALALLVLETFLRANVARTSREATATAARPARDVTTPNVEAA